MAKLITLQKGERYQFIGTYDRYSRKYDKYAKRYRDYFIFKDITDENGNIVSNYVCFDYIKSFAILNLLPGDKVKFRARVVACVSSQEALYYGYLLNSHANIYYRLMNPTKVSKLIKAARPMVIMRPQYNNLPSLYNEPTSPCPINIGKYVVK